MKKTYSGASQQENKAASFTAKAASAALSELAFHQGALRASALQLPPLRNLAVLRSFSKPVFSYFATPFLTLFILLFGVFLCSCSAPAKTDSETLSPSASSQQPASEEALQAEGSGVLKIVSGLRADITWGCPTEQGLYGLIVRGDGSENITYLDYTLGEEIVLCGQPGCMHDSESCTGWFPAGYGGAVPLTDGKHLYFMFLEICLGRKMAFRQESFAKN